MRLFHSFHGVVFGINVLLHLLFLSTYLILCLLLPLQVRADGHDIPSLLKAVLHLLPLDTYVDKPVALMDPVPNDKARGLKTPIWDEYRKIVDESEGKPINIELVERFAFYDRSKQAFAVVATGESALYGNIILKKGALP